VQQRSPILISGGTSSTRHSDIRGAEMLSCAPLQKSPACSCRSLRPQHERRHPDPCHSQVFPPCRHRTEELYSFVYLTTFGAKGEGGRDRRGSGSPYPWLRGKNGRKMRANQQRGHLRRGVGFAMGSVSGWSRWRAFFPLTLVLFSSSLGLVCADFEIGGHLVETAKSSAISPRTGWWAAPYTAKDSKPKPENYPHVCPIPGEAPTHPLAYYHPVLLCPENCSHLCTS
jgi:hypothetical protein